MLMMCNKHVQNFRRQGDDTVLRWRFLTAAYCQHGPGQSLQPPWASLPGTACSLWKLCLPSPTEVEASGCLDPSFQFAVRSAKNSCSERNANDIWDATPWPFIE